MIPYFYGVRNNYSSFSLLALSKKKCRHVYGIEVQEEIAEVARRNAELNGLENSFTVIGSDLRSIKSSDIGFEVDFVFSNPPYMKADGGKQNVNEQKNISRHEIFGEINDFCACAKRLLKHGGDFYVVYRPDRMADLVCAMRESGIEPKTLCFVYQSVSHQPCLMLISGKKGGKSGMTLLRPLILTENGEQTEDVKKIYESGAWVD